MTAEAGHASNEFYVDQGQDAHLNGCSFFNDAEEDISGALEEVVGILDVAQQDLSGAGALTVTEYYTAWTTTGADAGTLANGSFIGQLKKVQLVVDGGDGTLTPASMSGGTTVTFADIGDTAEFRWNGTGWRCIALYNCADGTSAPVLA